MSSILAKKKLLMAKGGVDISELFNASLWTGNVSDRTITTGIDSGDGSLVWIKRRDSTPSHIINDTLRGPLSYISSNTTSARTTTTGVLTAFTSSGYSIGTNNVVNFNTGTFVGWQFRRAENFFDIVQYTGNGVYGREIHHNLGIIPGLIICKRVDSVANWQVFHFDTGASQGAQLNLTSSFQGVADWAATSPTSTSFFVGNDSVINGSGGSYIAYLFAHDPSPQGIIQCGSYVGNGSSTGPTVNLGWQPQYLLVKNATSTGDWQILDSTRGMSSSNESILLANTNGAETSVNLVTPGSTGFQVVSTISNINTNGQTYVYMAIREA